MHGTESTTIVARCECRILDELCPEAAVITCYVCGDALCEDCSKRVSLRGEGWVSVCRCGTACLFAVDQRRANPGYTPDRAVRR